MVIKFVCEYNGKDFHGFQRQKNLRTVQAVLEDALSKYFGENIKIAGSGRTDAGVHAKGQTCSFRPAAAISVTENNLYKLCTAINAFLPEDVSVRDFEIKQDNFHAQFSAKAKTYIYRCYVNCQRSALRAGTHLQLYKWPDLEKMQKAARSFTGTCSFKEFTTEKTDRKDFVRTIYDLNIRQEATDEIVFAIRGDGFLRNMVRIICGRLLDNGYGAAVKRVKKLPALGLTLDNVEY